MFGQPRDHPYGGPLPQYNNGHFSRPPVGMTAGAPYQPPPHARGRGRGSGSRGGGEAPVGYQHPSFSGPVSHQGYSPLNVRSPPLGLTHPPPPPGNPPAEALPPPPPADGTDKSAPKATNPRPPPPPPMPKDPEMLKNIEVLSSFVAKNGPQFENMAREKQADNPKFSFLFGGERGSDAATGLDFYEWKKIYLAWEERNKPANADQLRLSEWTQQVQRGEVGAAPLSHEVPSTSTGSDMEMEDDFALTPPTIDRKAGSDRGSIVSPPKRERMSGFSSPLGDKQVELPSQGTDRKVGPTSPGFERKSRFSSPSSEKRASSSSTAERKSHGNLSQLGPDSKLGTSSGVPVIQEPPQPGTSRWSADQSGTSEPQHVAGDREKGSQGPEGLSTGKESAVSDLPRRRDLRRRTGFDRPCMEDVSLQSSPSRIGQPKENQRELAANLELERKIVPPNGHPDVASKPSRWGPPESGSAHHGNRERVSDRGPGTGELSSLSKAHKESDLSHHKAEESLTRDQSQSPKVSGKTSRASDDNTRGTDRAKSRSTSDPVPVDEFGRVLRRGGSDSDGEGHFGGGKKRRRSTSRSRSRSRSPGDLRRKRWSPSCSPRRRGRRSRSWSASPRRQRSRSRTPPREGRWGGEGRGEKGYADRGGRRGGRGGGGGQPRACLDFAKGRCQRGANCKFLHDEGNGVPDDQGGRWGGNRGRGRGRGRAGRDMGEDAERNWGGKGAEGSRPRRTWNTNERSADDVSREKRSTEEMKKQEAESSSDESWQQKKRDKALAPGSTGTAEQASIENSASRPDGDSAVPVTSQLAKTSSDYMCQVLSPSATYPSSMTTQVPHQISGLSNPVSSPQQPSYPSPTTNQYPISLGSHVSQHLSFSVSPSSQPQSKFTLNHPHPQQGMFSSTQQSSYPSNAPNIPHKSSFSVNRSHQQSGFTSPPVSFTANPSMSTQQQLAYAPVALRPPSSFSSPQQHNFASIPMSMPMSVAMSVSMSSGHGGLMSRNSGISTPPQMLQVPIGPNLTQGSRLGYLWTTPKMGPAASYGLPSQQISQQQPPPPPPPPTQPQALPPQAPPPQVLHQPPLPYLHPLPVPSSFPTPSYSSIASQLSTPTSMPAKDQYDPLADTLEPGPPGAGDKKGLASFNQNNQQDIGRRHTVGAQWKLHAAHESTPLMTNAGEVVLENVSPGLPGHMENARSSIGVLENVSPTGPGHMVMENVSPTNVGSSFNINTSMNYGGSHQGITMENVSPCPDANPAGDGQGGSAEVTKEQKKKDKDGRVLNLIRKAVAEHVKDLLKPTWKEGQMSKDAFKTIAKKAVDKVIGALEAKGSIPKSQEKLDLFMDTSKPKIAKLVQGYVDKYVKA